MQITINICAEAARPANDSHFMADDVLAALQAGGDSHVVELSVHTDNVLAPWHVSAVAIVCS